MTTDFSTFISWEQASRDTIDVKKIYIDMAGDLIAGMLLSQIIYWYLPSKETGKSKITIIKGDKEWIAKARYEWWDEIRISPKQLDRAVRSLETLGIIETEIHRFGGLSIKHIRIVKEVFLQLWNAIIYDPVQNPHLPKGEKRRVIYPKVESVNSPNGKSQFTETSKALTKSTSEIEVPIAPDKPDAEAVEPEKKKRVNPSEPWHDALVAAFGIDPETLTKTADGNYWKVATELRKSKFPVERVGELHAWVKRKSVVDRWKAFTVNVISKYAPEFLAATQPRTATKVIVPADWHPATDDFYDLANGTPKPQESA